MDRFPFGAHPGAFRRSPELAFSEAEAAFNSLSSELAAANVEREVQLGEPAVVLAKVAADIGTTSSAHAAAGPGAPPCWAPCPATSRGSRRAR